ncbi:MAG: thermonuclease family protein [Lysobacterales bacterium]
MRLVCSLILALAAVAPTAEARSLYGTVPSVEAADLLTLKHPAGSYAIRVYGVDLTDDSAANQAARQLTAAFVKDRTVRARIMTRNAAGEMESIVLADGKDLGLELLKAGLALRQPNVHYKPTRDGEADALVLAETEARLAHRGLWQLPEVSAAADDAEPERPRLPDALLVAGTVDINTSVKTGDDNECAAAIDPSNPQRMFLSCNTASAGLFATRTVNGGQTWTYPDASDKTIADGDAGQGQSACCDPTLAWDRFGNLYVTYINAATNSIVTLLSTDAGLTYTEIGNFTGSVDQPTIVAANVGANANIWIVWNDSGSIAARGAQATALGTVGAFGAKQTLAGSSDCNFGDIAISPTGVMVQICEQPSGGEGPANLRFATDADGLGAGLWSTATTATTTNVGGFDFIPAQNARSVDAEAGLAYDSLSTSPRFGRLYLVYTEETTNESNDLDVLVRYSDNNGSSWSTPIKVNDDATTRSQFLPKIAVDPTTGNIGVCWHDARASANNTTMQLYCATSAPLATPVFTPNNQVSDGASLSNGAGVEFGDYMGVAFVNGQLRPVWGDTSNSTANNPGGFDAYTDAATASPQLFKNGFE